MQKGKIAFFIFALILAWALTAAATEINVSRVAESLEPSNAPATPADVVMVQSPQDAYSGTLRLYIVERFSRYPNSDGIPHDNGFLDFATVENFTINDGETWESNVTWDASPFDGVIPSRMRAMAAIANQESFFGDADPPSGRGFTGNRVDAAASGSIGTPGYNETGTGFTHTIFIEEGSATW
jgi:hypothetical protein